MPWRDVYALERRVCLVQGTERLVCKLGLQVLMCVHAACVCRAHMGSTVFMTCRADVYFVPGVSQHTLSHARAHTHTHTYTHVHVHKNHEWCMCSISRRENTKSAVCIQNSGQLCVLYKHSLLQPCTGSMEKNIGLMYVQSNGRHQSKDSGVV